MISNLHNILFFNKNLISLHKNHFTLAIIVKNEKIYLLIYYLQSLVISISKLFNICDFNIII